MPRASLRNFHVPLPDDLYRRLRAEAASADVPATEIARDAIDHWLRERRRADMHRAIAAYAEECAGTRLDIDSDLEAASVEYLLSAEDRKR